MPIFYAAPVTPHQRASSESKPTNSNSYKPCDVPLEFDVTLVGQKCDDRAYLTGRLLSTEIDAYILM